MTVVRHHILPSLFALPLITMIAVIAAMGADVGRTVQPEAGPSASIAKLVRHINAALRLRDSVVVTLNIEASPGEVVVTSVPIEGVPFTLELRPHSVRAEEYQVLAQVEDGSLVSVEPGPVRTLRGSVVDAPGSVVAGSLLESGLHARLLSSDGEEYWVEPIGGWVAGATPDQHVLYRSDDVIPGEGTCAVDDGLIPWPDVGGLADGPHQVGPVRGGVSVTEFAADADYEYFQAYGSVAAVEDRINSIMNAVNVQYERDVGITHAITAIVVRTAESDPYDDAVFPGQLLIQFQEHWLANHADIPRDVAQLFTGRDLYGSWVGVAWSSSICTDDGFSLVQSDAYPDFAYVTDLTAHELGHNWGADHCVYEYTMNPTILGVNQFHPTDTIPEIIAFRDSCPCLDGCNDGGASIRPALSAISAAAIPPTPIDDP